MNIPKYTPEQALGKMMQLCSQSEKCEYDIQQKLIKYGLSNSDIENVIDKLIEEKFIDETRFCRAYVNHKFRFNNWGRVKIRHMLKTKKISNTNIEEALSSITDEEYCDKVMRILRSKLKNMPLPDDYNERNKVAAHVIRKGFEPDKVFAAMAEYRVDEL
ncbi:MAG: RecX family transcriptional regulator [Bacteroidales bacterium]|jgi:regulatory protein|nr:RecX family transcriptional regulator [Bacteroidales bacterium]